MLILGRSGQNFTLAAQGYLKQDVHPGSIVRLQANLHVGKAFIPIFRSLYDLCELLPDFGEYCPVDSGEIYLSRQSELPDEIPKGEYQVIVQAITDDKKELFCIETVLSL